MGVVPTVSVNHTVYLVSKEPNKSIDFGNSITMNHGFFAKAQASAYERARYCRRQLVHRHSVNAYAPNFHSRTETPLELTAYPG